jgi:tRNA (adenine22-N1)-methyltransferase
MLTPRLEAIAKMIPQGATIADVGTDHGYLPLALLKEARIPSAIAADINEKPLASARKNTGEEFLDQMQFRLGNGIEPIGLCEVELVVIAGMGGELITEILSADWEKTRSLSTYILQPMVKVPFLRKFLHQNHFCILDEEIVREGNKFYQIIKVVHGEEEAFNPIYEEVGPVLLRKAGTVLDEYLDFRIERIEIIQAQLRSCQESKNDEIMRWEKKKQEFLEVKEDVGK